MKISHNKSLNKFKQSFQLPSINSNTFTYKKQKRNHNSLHTLHRSDLTIDFNNSSQQNQNSNFDQKQKYIFKQKQSRSFQLKAKIDQKKFTLLSINNQNQKNKIKLTKTFAKYLPRNSSFSLLYGQKQTQVEKQSQIQSTQLHLHQNDRKSLTNQSSSNTLKTLNQLIAGNLDMNHILKQERKPNYRKFQIHQRKSSIKTNHLKKDDTNQISAEYLKTIEILKKKSLIQSSKGKNIIQKSILKQNEIHQKYQQLKDQSIQAIDGYTNYHLQQQTSQKYRQELRQMWMRGDANRKLFK